MNEIELKFRLDADEARQVKTRLKALEGLRAVPRARKLHSVYCDTPGHDLRAEGIALRLRKEGRRWVQTVKAGAQRHGALQSVTESECPAPGGRLTLEGIPDAALRDRVAALVPDGVLAPVCETEMSRTAVERAGPGGDVAEIAVDEGVIRAGDRAEPFCELEIELRSGRMAVLFDTARRLLPEGGLKISRRSKAARGFLLAEAGQVEPPLAPHHAGAVALQAGQSAETAARDVLRDCFEQISANAEVVRRLEDPEGPHQLRVGLRRLRSAFLVFRDVIGGSAAASHLNAEARWLGQQVGALRDLDVAQADLLVPEAAAHPDETGFEALNGRLGVEADKVRDALRVTLGEARTQMFILDLAEFIETRGWLLPDDFGQTERLAQPVERMAKRALEKRWTRVSKRARGIATLDIEARHELRKDLKKLRYGIEFFAPVLPPKRTKAFLKRLKTLQQLFGDLNDLAMAQELFTGPGAPGARDAGVQRAVGLILGSRAVKAEAAWHDARALWEALRAEPRPW